jgi:hypothetical protein
MKISFPSSASTLPIAISTVLTSPGFFYFLHNGPVSVPFAFWLLAAKIAAVLPSFFPFQFLFGMQLQRFPFPYFEYHFFEIVHFLFELLSAEFVLKDLSDILVPFGPFP